jgi:hypothetical protein
MGREKELEMNAVEIMLKVLKDTNELGFIHSFEELEDAIAVGEAELRPCHWTEDEGMWATSCGNAFMLNDGTPTDNNMKFCCYCGKGFAILCATFC